MQNTAADNMDGSCGVAMFVLPTTALVSDDSAFLDKTNVTQAQFVRTDAADTSFMIGPGSTQQINLTSTVYAAITLKSASALQVESFWASSGSVQAGYGRPIDASHYANSTDDIIGGLFGFWGLGKVISWF